VRTALRAPWLRGLGTYSYGLYVFHGIVSYGIDRHSPEAILSRLVGVHLVAASLQIAIGVTLSLLLAVASYELFEVHFLKWKKWFDYAGSRSGARHSGQDEGDRRAAGGAFGIAG
jgi:peptidoglycan/LPS O-acetylase OafA/YrhL